MTTGYVTVTEWHGGLSKSSMYYFIIEGKSLVHISRYATFKKYDPDVGEAQYVVDLSVLRGKTAVIISASNRGISCYARVLPAENIALGGSGGATLPLSYLNEYTFTHLSRGEQDFLSSEWRPLYTPMIEDLRGFIAELSNSAWNALGYPARVILPELVECQLESGASYPLSYLIPYNDTARKRSLEQLTKWVHQLWVIAGIARELRRRNKLQNLYLNFGQTSYYPVASFTCRDGLCSLWYEFDATPHTMCKGMLWQEGLSLAVPPALEELYERANAVKQRLGLQRTPLRPDIAILAGGLSCEELKEGFRVKAIVECKNEDFERWSRDVEKQLIAYKEVFQPEAVVLASAKTVPGSFKLSLRTRGVIVVDNVRPGGGGLSELLQIIGDI
ncbi:hypothetical protein [Thermogladius calderae]|uniref:hypothetical protein n=1 Tax=Thermogladius calderae TaxID=1200300 RepID=UPI00064E256B|nr:hypothetical protein [Thermogladius calderae]